MKKINYLYLLLFCIGTTLANWGCSDDNEKEDPVFIVSIESLAFTKEGGDKIMHIKTNQKWTVSSSESWCTVSPSSGEATGTIKLTVTATANTTTDVRNAILSVTAGGVTKQVTVTQELTNLLLVKKSEYAVEAEGESITVELQTSATHEISIEGDWITKTTARSFSEVSEIFTIAPNTTIFEREGTITFKVADLVEKVTIRQSGVSENITADKTGMASDALVLAGKMKLGWNLGNSLEACDATSAGETSWGNPLTSKKLIDAVKAGGFNVVRIPCAWSGYIEDETTYKIKSSWLARVKEVVDYCIDNNMYVILNIHWDGGWLENNPTYDKQEAVNMKQKALWKQISIYFRDYDEHLLFAGANEVHKDYNAPSTENITVQMSYNQTFVDAVRATGGRNAWRNLIVQAYNTNIDYAVSYLKMPVDATSGRLMSEVHFYDPYDFTLSEDSSSKTQWGKPFIGGDVSSWGQEAWVDEVFGKMKTNFIDKGIPVVLGEYGAVLRASLSAALQAKHIEARNYYLNYVTKAAKNNGLIPVYWDNGNAGDKGSGLFNRSTGEQAHSDAVNALVSAVK